MEIKTSHSMKLCIPLCTKRVGSSGSYFPVINSFNTMKVLMFSSPFYYFLDSSDLFLGKK